MSLQCFWLPRGRGCQLAAMFCTVYKDFVLSGNRLISFTTGHFHLTSDTEADLNFQKFPVTNGIAFSGIFRKEDNVSLFISYN